MLTQTTMRAGSFKQAMAAVRPPSAGTAQAGTIEMMGAVMQFARGSEIYGENEPADYLYKIVRGAVRTYKVLVDGRRQIGGFYLPGDIFGLETGDLQTFSVEAISGCKIGVVRGRRVIELGAAGHGFA